MTPRDEYARRLTDLRAAETRFNRQLAAAGNARFAAHHRRHLAGRRSWPSFDRCHRPGCCCRPRRSSPYPIAFIRAERRLAAIRRAVDLLRPRPRAVGGSLARSRRRRRGISRSKSSLCRRSGPVRPRVAVRVTLYGPHPGRVGRCWPTGCWTPASSDEIDHRQEAVRELADRPEWRERLALAGDDLAGRARYRTHSRRGAARFPGRRPSLSDRWQLAS